MKIDSIQNQITANHEAAHAVVAAVAGFEVASLSVRANSRSLGRCWSVRLDSLVSPWDLNYLVPRNAATGCRDADQATPRLELCTNALMNTQDWSRAELIRLIRSEVCISLAGHAQDGECTYHHENPYPDGHDFDTVQMCLQWLRHLGEDATADDLLYFVEDVLEYFDEAIQQIANALVSKKYLRRLELAKLLPQPWANWPPSPSTKTPTAAAPGALRVVTG